MKRLLFIVFLAATQASCLAPSVIMGSGKEAHGEFDIATGYTSLSVSSGITVELILSDTGAGSIAADEKVLQFVSIMEDGGRVKISYEPFVSINSPVKTVVRLPLSAALDHIDASSAARITSGRRIVAQSMGIDCSSAADVELDIDAGELRLNLSSASSFGGNVAIRGLEADLSSASSCEIEGSAEHADVSVSSAAHFRGSGLVCRRAHADASSGAGIQITAADEIVADASSGGSVRYGGEPAIVRRNASSGGSVRAIK